MSTRPGQIQFQFQIQIQFHPLDLEYIAYALEGLTNKEIAARKGVSSVTVSKRFSSICQKLQVEGKKELVEYAKRSLFEYARH